MLNELLIVERGVRQAVREVEEWHIDVKDVGMKPTLRVRLDASGQVASIDPVPTTLRLWTLGKGNKKRFPFSQPNAPLLRCEDELMRMKLETLRSLRGEHRRACVLDLCKHATFNEANLIDWPGVRDKNGNWSQDPSDYLNALRKRRKQLQELEETEGKSVLAAIDRFLAACSATENGGVNLLYQITSKLMEMIEYSPGDDWLRVAESLLFLGSGALFFDVPSSEFSRLVSDPRQPITVSQVLRIIDKGEGSRGRCSLTGKEVHLVEDTFPELVLPVIGKTILFSRFIAIPSNGRYKRFGAKSLAVGQTVAENLAANLRFLTSRDRKLVTWRSLPSEVPKQMDLLLAFVEGVLDAPVAAELAEEDFTEEATMTASDATNSVAAFEKRTKRLIEAVRAKVTDFSNTPVQLTIFRKVDPANRKVIYASAPTVTDLYRAATTWIVGEGNVPPWLILPVLEKGEQKPRLLGPPHIAPLGLSAFSKKLFVRGGKESQEVVGLTAAESLRFFLDAAENGSLSVRHRVQRLLRLVLVRRATLVIGTAHALRCGFDLAKDYDRHETLRTVTLLGLLLHKLDRKKEVYMNEAAFKLGQLLAAADVVHAGYCADVRGGDVPPSLLGNQIFAMAQSAPTKALATLCRRWKPYDGWAKKATREPHRAEALIGSKNKDEQQRGWDIKRALRYAREMAPLSAELAQALEACRLDDTFLAELLLGYIAGFPKLKKEDTDGQDQNQNEKQED